MQIAIYTLYTVALILQLGGAALVVMDVKQSQEHMATFKHRLDEASQTRSSHLQDLGVQRSMPSPFGGSIQLPQINPAAREQWVDQLGPSAMEERKALTEFVQSQYEVSKSRRWLGVGLLFTGVVTGYLASVLSVSG